MGDFPSPGEIGPRCFFVVNQLNNRNSGLKQLLMRPPCTGFADLEGPEWEGWGWIDCKYIFIDAFFTYYYVVYYMMFAWGQMAIQYKSLKIYNIYSIHGMVRDLLGPVQFARL